MNSTLEQEATIPKFMFDSLRSNHESLTRRYEEQEDRIAELERLVEQKEKQLESREKRVNTLWTELSWMRKVHLNPTFKPVEKDVLITAHDHARTGEPARLYVASMARQTGMARNTYGSTLQKLDGFGILEWNVGDAQKDGENFGREGMLTFSEQLLRNPDEIVIERGPENRGGNAKEKAAKKACPECNSIQLEEGKICYCKNCNHQWEEGKRKDVNVVSPADEMREASNVKPSSDVPEDDLHRNMDTLFPDEAKQAKTGTIPDIDENKPPRPHPLCHPKNNFVYDDLIERWFCEVCNHG